MKEPKTRGSKIAFVTALRILCDEGLSVENFHRGKRRGGVRLGPIPKKEEWRANPEAPRVPLSIPTALSLPGTKITKTQLAFEPDEIRSGTAQSSE